MTSFFAARLELFPAMNEFRESEEGGGGVLERIYTWFVVVVVVVEDGVAFSEVTSLGDDGVVEVGVCLTWKREGRR